MANTAGMAFGEAIRIAAASLWSHKLRSVLTLLGVVVGVTAVIAVVSFINGMNSYVAEKVFNLGADVFVIAKGSAVITNIDQFLEMQRRKNFSVDDYEALRAQCKRCVAVGGTLGSRREVRFGNNSLRDVGTRGWTPAMAKIYDLEIVAGRVYSEAEEARGAQVCVIGWDIVENLFAGVDPVGREIRIGTITYTIVGVGKKEGSALGQSRDNYLMMPLNTYLKSFQPARYSLRIWGKANGPAELEATMDEIRQILRGRRHLAYAQPDDFVIETQDAFLSIWAGISAAFFAVVVAVASISLVVGGIVIMNIMLVSVSERTHEIGLRKSVGARQRDIQMQFLIESATIAAIGGLCGVLGGVLLAKLVSWVTPLPSAIEAWSVIAGLLVATGVGLFFGIYPASRAAKLDPVVALRAE